MAHVETNRGSETTPAMLRPVAARRDVVERGDSGPEVRRTQELLNRHGADLEVDSMFGDRTEAAVRSFQRKHKLEVDGKVGDKTLKKLLESPRSSRERDDFQKLGDDNPEVLKTERRLKSLGYDPGAVDGKYDGKTARAVADFKEDQPDINSTTGRRFSEKEQQVLAKEVRALGHEPYHRRRDGNAETRQRDTETRMLAARQNDDGTEGFALGERGPAVRNVQRHLQAAGFDPKHANGEFDERTTGAVRHFQRHAGLPITGRVDSDTWAKLSEATVESKNTPQTMGERSNDVLKSERLLKKLGMRPGKVDGIFDRDTQRASRRFERTHPGNGDNGKIGRGQVENMEEAVRAEGPIRLAPRNMSQRQKHQYYSDIVRAHGGKVNPNKPTVLGIRGLAPDGTRSSGNMSTKYQDTFVVLLPGGRVREVRGSTRPGQSRSSDSPDVTGDGVGDVGMLKPGSYSVVANGPHAGAASYHVRTKSGGGFLPGWRDTNHDGVYSAREKRASERRGDRVSEILFHQGNSSSPSSIGCLTFSPAEMQRFIGIVGGSGASFDFTLVDAKGKRN